MGREFLPVAGIGQAVETAVAEDGLVEKAEPFLHSPIAGDDEDPVSAGDQLVDGGRLLAGEALEAQIGQNEQTSLYRSVGGATLRGTPGIGIAMRD